MRAQLEQLLHTTLHNLGVEDTQAHNIVDWIARDDDETRRVWQLRAAGMFAIGLALGLALGALAIR